METMFFFKVKVGGGEQQQIEASLCQSESRLQTPCGGVELQDVPQHVGVLCRVAASEHVLETNRRRCVSDCSGSRERGAMLSEPRRQTDYYTLRLDLFFSSYRRTHSGTRRAPSALSRSLIMSLLTRRVLRVFRRHNTVTAGFDCSTH